MEDPREPAAGDVFLPDGRDEGGTGDEAGSASPGAEPPAADQGPPSEDRYLQPDEDSAATSSYVRNEAPWVGFEDAPPPADPDGPAWVPGGGPPVEDVEFTRIIRHRRRARDAVAWAVTAGAVVLAAWGVPTLLEPTSQLARFASYGILILGGAAAVFAVVRVWRWALGRT